MLKSSELRMSAPDVDSFTTVRFFVTIGEMKRRMELEVCKFYKRSY